MQMVHDNLLFAAIQCRRSARLSALHAPRDLKSRAIRESKKGLPVPMGVSGHTTCANNDDDDDDDDCCPPPWSDVVSWVWCVFY
jgi:hypothetical protein